MNTPVNKSRLGRPKGTGTQRVYARVREQILQLDLPPGADVNEAGLEAEFGVSRTPVREALIRLASEGLITLLAQPGRTGVVNRTVRHCPDVRDAGTDPACRDPLVCGPPQDRRH